MYLTWLRNSAIPLKRKELIKPPGANTFYDTSDRVESNSSAWILKVVVMVGKCSHIICEIQPLVRLPYFRYDFLCIRVYPHSYSIDYSEPTTMDEVKK